jgi:hypothetical protein
MLARHRPLGSIKALGADLSRARDANAQRSLRAELPCEPSATAHRVVRKHARQAYGVEDHFKIEYRENHRCRIADVETA